MRNLLKKFVLTYDERQLLDTRPQYPLLKTACDFVNHNEIEGDVFEFGCHTGKTFNELQRLTPGRRHFAFDSFEGLPDKESSTGGPPPREPHEYEPSHWGKGAFSTDLESFRRAVGDAAIVVDGWYHETLDEKCKVTHELNMVALVHIDCDLYESAIRCLDFITDLVQDGTVIVFDDWGFYRGQSDLGEQKALNEWLTSNPGIIARELGRQGFDKYAIYLELD